MGRREKMKEYVILRHLRMPNKGMCFFTTNSEDDPTHGNTGELWYEIIGYADEVKEAQDICKDNYGGLPDREEFDNYVKEKIKERNKRN